MANKVALVTGITGQDGSFLTELLLEKGYQVHGVVRRSSSFNTGRIDHLYHDLHTEGKSLELHYGDLSDASGLRNLVMRIKPDEVYNLGAQSHVRVSFDHPEYTANIVGLGCLRLLDAVRDGQQDLSKDIRFYQASSSEIFGKVQETPQKETTPFYPRSPYACAKVYAYWQTVNYRESYDIHASNGILFNHESERRGETFVTRKITKAATRIALGLQDKLYLGHLDAKRDWGYAKDFVEGMWQIVQQNTPDDFVLATGKTYSVRAFLELVFIKLGVTIAWSGSGVDEVGVIDYVGNRDCVEGCKHSFKVGDEIIAIDPRYFRPAEVDLLLGDASKAKDAFGWTATTNLKEMVDIMTIHDLKSAITEKHMASLI
jgi:GDPmannose 4,6-dehydratase